MSVFAVGFADHFVAESGGDQSITNSNSNFGSCALRAKGFKTEAFTQDKAGTVTHIIPPQRLARTYASASGTYDSNTQTWSGTTFTLSFDDKIVPATSNSHGIVVGDYVRFGQDDHPEAYLVTAVDGSTGQLTLNRGYRNISNAVNGAGKGAYKGIVSEIPVGYVALDVQKIQKNAFGGNATRTGATTNVQVGDSTTYLGNAYVATAVTGTGSVGSTPPVHTSGIAPDGDVTWAYIGAVNTRLYLYGYTSIATKPPFKLQGFNIGARKQDVMYVSLIDGSTQVTYAALISPDGSTTPADGTYTAVTENGFSPGDANHPIQYDSYLNCLLYTSPSPRD